MKEKALYIGKRIISHELISGSSLLFLGSMVSNVCAFLFNLFVVRKLSYSAYGEYAALISIITMLSIPAQSFSPVIIRFGTDYLSKKEIGKASELYWHTTRFFIVIAAVLIFAISIGNTFLKSFFHIPDTFLLLFAGAVVALSYIAVPNGAFVQSYLRFGFISFSTVMNGIVKLLSGILFILAGWQVLGALGAIFTATIVGFALSFWPLRGLLTHHEEKKSVPVREIITYALPAIVAVFALSSLISTDILLVKHFFPTNQAGLYAGLSLIGRIIFYFTAPITAVMFPLVIKRYQQKQNFRGLLYVALLLVLIPSVGITLFYFLFPHVVIALFLGGKGYYAISSYIGWYGVFLCFYSLLNVLVNFFLSLKRTEVVILIFLGALAQASGIALFHGNFASVIEVSIVTSFGLLLLLLLYYYRLYGIQKPL